MAKRKNGASSAVAIAARDVPAAQPRVVTADRRPLHSEDKGFTMKRFLERQQAVKPSTAASPETDPESPPAREPTLPEVLANAETAPTPDKGKPRAGETPSKPRTLKALAELAKLEVSDLYELEIPLEAANGDKVGKTVTLGQLKDAQAKQADLETRTVAFEEAKTKTENELLRARQQLQEIVAQLPKGAVKPELIAKMNAETEAYRAAETERLAEAIPEWDDNGKRAADRAVILEHLGEYGYGPQAFDGLIDHRMVKYVRDSALRWRRMNEALAKVKEVKPKPPASASKPAVNGANRSRESVKASNLSPSQLRGVFNISQ